ncbi:recombinase family protein [Clostridia bacterium]|nr:recombinase family protein [Clostridia bacterium]
MVTENQSAMKRVAAYARVSTDNDEQLSSFKAQRDYYVKHIHSKPDWKFVEIYTDEGISATSTKKRDGFNRMIKDAIGGKIDLIITKSVSRFARNTVDSLTTIRRLKEKNVEVFFEKENIYSLDSKGELMLTIMSSLAQEESQNISSNVKWGQRKRFADGKVSLPYGRFLGYEKGKDNIPQVVEKEAVVIRRIYRLFLEGKTPSNIARVLTKERIRTPGGKEKWSSSTVKSILMNEKYKGDAILQKTFTTDFLTKKKKINEGELPKYYVENSHQAIVDPETYELVQEEFKRRKASGKTTSSINCFASRVTCGACGGFFGRKVWHSNTKYATTIWQCNNKFRKKTYCHTPHLKEEDLKKAFVGALNSLIESKEEILKTCDEVMNTITDYTKEENEVRGIQEEADAIGLVLEKLIGQNARLALDQEEYSQKYNSLASKYNELQENIHTLNEEIIKKKAKRNQMTVFIRELRRMEHLISEFDETLWSALVTTVVVNGMEELIFHFRGGTMAPWQIKE